MIPFVFMIISNILLIQFVRASRARIGKSIKQTNQTRRDRRMAFLILTLNLVFLALNTPIVVQELLVTFEETNPFFNYIAYLLYYSYYAIGFYTLVTINLEFRREFLKILKRCSNISDNENQNTVKDIRVTNKYIANEIGSSQKKAEESNIKDTFQQTSI